MNVYLCFLFLGLAFADPLSEHFFLPLEAEDIRHLESIRDSLEGGAEVLTATVNVFADKILKNVDKYMKKNVDPSKIPDISEKIHYMLFSGQFTLSKGTLSDISTLHRDGTVSVSYSKKTHKMDLSIPLTFDSLKILYDYKIQIMGLGPVGQMKGTVNKFQMTINLGVDFDELQMQFKKYQIRNSGSIKLHFYGSGILGWMISICTNVATAALNPIIMKIIESIVAGNLKSVIENVNDIINVILGQ